LSQSALSRIERGRRTIKLYQLTAIASALGVTADWLVRPPDDDD
jgi:transcriptional regulator with XRE-family HTH domain